MSHRAHFLRPTSTPPYCHLRIDVRVADQTTIGYRSVVTPRFELFDHTADMGIRAFASTLAELVDVAVAGLYATIGELTAAGGAEKISYDRTGLNSAELLRDLLAEVLLLFELKHRKVTGATAEEFSENHLRVTLSVAEVDFEKSVFFREVKAVTYHELDIRLVDGGYEATFIVDI
ncbi:MAG: archease [Planctomycetota bacterium]